MEDYKYKDETYAIIGAAYKVHNELGPGFLEEIYQAALAVELELSGIPFEKEKLLNVYYRGHALDKYYKADFFCYGKIVVELKATKQIIPEHVSQTLNYLKATKSEVALILNFGAKSLEKKRIALTQLGTTVTTPIMPKKE